MTEHQERISKAMLAHWRRRKAMGRETMTALKRLRASDRIKELEAALSNAVEVQLKIQGRAERLEAALREIASLTSDGPSIGEEYLGAIARAALKEGKE